MQVWKEFEGNEVTHSMAHYLMAIKELLRRQGYARVTDVARELEITPGSASVSLKTLKSKGFVSEDHNRFLGLTEEGEKIAHGVQVAKSTFVHFFHDILGVSKEQSEIDSCKIEHLVSEETRMHLLTFLQYSLGDAKPAKAFREGLKQHHFQCPGPQLCEICGDEPCKAESLHEH